MRDDDDSEQQIGETIPRSPSPSHSDYSDDQTDPDLNGNVTLLGWMCL